MYHAIRAGSMSKMRDLNLLPTLSLSLTFLHLTGRQCLLTLVNERSENGEEKGKKEVRRRESGRWKTDSESADTIIPQLKQGNLSKKRESREWFACSLFQISVPFSVLSLTLTLFPLLSLSPFSHHRINDGIDGKDRMVVDTGKLRKEGWATNTNDLLFIFCLISLLPLIKKKKEKVCERKKEQDFFLTRLDEARKKWEENWKSLLEELKSFHKNWVASSNFHSLSYPSYLSFFPLTLSSHSFLSFFPLTFSSHSFLSLYVTQAKDSHSQNNHTPSAALITKEFKCLSATSSSSGQGEWREKVSWEER